MIVKHAIATYLPWLLSALTIYSAVLAGDKKPAAWTVGVANQFLWATWIVASETWGMLPMNVVLAVIFARNLVKWRREEWFHLEAK